MVEYVDFLGEVEHDARLTKTMYFRVGARRFRLCVSKRYMFLAPNPTPPTT